jgi:hypothetical protein
MRTAQGLGFSIGFALLLHPAWAAEQACDIEVRVVTPGAPSATAAVSAPSDAIVLFDGKDLSLWQGTDGPATWHVHDGVATVRKGAGDIQTKRKFRDFQLHIEWRISPDVTGQGQERGNSGVYLQGHYEIQVLDSYRNRTFANGQAGAIFGQTPPLVNTMQRPGQWNVYDIIYTAPRFNDDDTLFSPARVTLLHNGVLIQNNTEILGDTGTSGTPGYLLHGDGPIVLQEHGDASRSVSYRNIWIRELGVRSPKRALPTQRRGPSRSQAPLTVDSSLRDLLKSSAGRAVLSECVPDLLPSPPLPDAFTRMSLRQMQKFIGGLTDTKLQIIDIELARGASESDRKQGESLSSPRQ